jgi:predicted RNase H-like HicB family nuclease
MQIPVLVEPLKGNGYRARGSEPFALTAKGATREEAIAKLRAKIQQRLKEGAEVVGLDLGVSRPPLLKFAGMFKDDPLFENWQRSIAEYRHEVDEDPDYL